MTQSGHSQLQPAITKRARFFDYKYREAHRDLRISPAEFDEVAAELGRTLDFFKVPKREKGEVLAAFAAHKDEVTAGYVAKRG